MNNIKKQKCQACQGGEDPLDVETTKILMKQVNDDWFLNESGWLVLEMEARDFEDSVEWVRKVGELAEGEGHHPNLYIYDYKKFRIELYTHKINGLHVNDFILAAKIDELR